MIEGAIWKYYAIAGMTIAIRDASGLKFPLTDYLGSIVAITDVNGSLLTEQRYLPFGQERTDVGTITQTDFGYTGQRDLGMGLMDYKARFYDAPIGRFLQPDTIVPSLAYPQSFNRFGYVFNNPIRFNDPSGHCVDPITGLACLTVIEIGIGLALTVAAVSYVTYPDIRENANQLSDELIAAAQRTRERWQENKRSEDIARQIEATSGQTADQGIFPKGAGKGCGKSLQNAALCITSGVFVAGALIQAGFQGGCDEPESNSACPPKPTPTSSPISSLTTTLTPTYTFSPTSTRTPTNTQTKTPSPTNVPRRITQPLLAIPFSNWERRLRLKGLE